MLYDLLNVYAATHCGNMPGSASGVWCLPSQIMWQYGSSENTAMFVPLPAMACGTDANCVARQDGSDTCDVTHGLCYKKAAVPGSACASDGACPLDGVCSLGPRFEGGYCQTFGCAANATTGIDACPGTNSFCGQRGGPDEPISSCYEKCTSGGPACSRASAGYRCESLTTNGPLNVCLVNSGT